MEFLAPFWDQLFHRCDVQTQAALLRVCRRVHHIGMTDENLYYRLRCKALNDPYLSHSSQHYISQEHRQRHQHQYLIMVPQKLRTLEMCLKAVRYHGLQIKWVPHHLRTPEICLEAVKAHNDAFQYVPKQSMTEECCVLAVRSNSSAILHVPDSLRTPAVCLAAVKFHAPSIQYLTPEQQTEEVCLAAVRQDGYVLPSIWNPSAKVCLEAVLENRRALQYV
uniref:DUF4116 domain-containing protein n=1 Tax=viral metagenome TaxID=1070528 RepID=A0A6C0BPU9_9ZZZZ